MSKNAKRYDEEKEKNHKLYKIEPRKYRHWVFERSSGYAGYRCTKCMKWVYNTLPLICDCVDDKK